jgi:2-oxoisovalerate dehydrogenase E1 component
LFYQFKARCKIGQIKRYPERLSFEEFWPIAYYWMFFSRKFEEQLIELFRKRYVKGTVTLGIGNEATAVGMSFPFRPAKDIVSLLHRDISAHMIMGDTPYEVMCQYMANADSPTHGREGNVHHANAFCRRFPMISHLGNMLSTVVGGVWSARQNNEEVFGLAVIGDGGSSTGEFHESLNIASVRKVPVLFLIENNHYAYSTPTRLQYSCKNISDRAIGYGIKGETIDGTDAWQVYCKVYSAIEEMQKTSMPYLLECMTLRLCGHAVYDNAEYVTEEEKKVWQNSEPIIKGRKSLLEIGFTEDKILEIEEKVIKEINDIVKLALEVPRPDPKICLGNVFSDKKEKKILEPFKISKVKNINAVNLAIDYIMSRNSNAVLLGLDVGPYGSAFKTCKGLYEKYGPMRVLDMPLAESAIVGFALGASQIASLPIVEFQFADFSTEAATQLGLNCATWYFRSGKEAPILFRLPCGSGITLGAFHSGEFEGIWSRFCGLKILYPYTPQETFEAIIAGFYDPNPCMVMEHKLLYGSKSGDINFDGNLDNIFKERKYSEGNDCTIVGIGAMLDPIFSACKELNGSFDIINPFVLSPLNPEIILESVKKTGLLCIVQESNEVAGLADRIVSIVCREAFSYLKKPPVIVSSLQTPVPFAPELEAFFRPDKEKVKIAIKKLTGV